MLSKFAYLMLCGSIQLLILLARGDAAKDLERHCCIERSPRPTASTSPLKDDSS